MKRRSISKKQEYLEAHLRISFLELNIIFITLTFCNRYGKLLQQISPLKPGWGGIYSGTEMPSSDYWFRYEYDNGKVLQGHFALKR